MLSISPPSTTGRFSKYFEKDDYYLQEKGEWQGQGAAILGLSDAVTPEAFKALMDGKHPESGVQLRSQKGDKMRAGMDLTFSAPKSASILAMGDGRIKDLHDQAVTTTLAYIEKENIQARYQIDGERRTFHTENALFATFNHLTSRELDPQLHTHCVLINLTQTPEGEFRAVHNDSLFTDRNKLGLMYRNTYANLLQQNGFKIDITDRKNGFFEIKGVDENLIKAFSSRREQVVATVEEWKREGKYADLEEGKLYELAALQSRSAKEKAVDKNLLKASWLEIINENGTSLEQMKSASRMTHEEYTKFMTPTTADKEISLAASLITGSESVFRKNELLSEAARISLGNHSIKNLERALEIAIGRNEILDLGEKTDHRNTFRNYSTQQMKLKEREVLETVLNSKNDYTPQFEKNAVLSFLEKKNQSHGWEFTKGQTQSILTILTSKDRVNVIQGDAGTGKTTYLKEIKELLDGKKMDIYGIGFTGKSSEAMKHIGIETSTINSFLSKDIQFVEPENTLKSTLMEIMFPDTNKNFKIKKGSILVIDEASMTGSVHFHEVLKIAEAGNLKVIIQGDKKQLPSISAGRIHDILQSRTNVDKVFLNEPVRQKEEKNAFKNVQDFKKNGMNGFIESLKSQNNIVVKRKRDELIETMIDTYLKFKNEEKVMVLVDKNDIRNQINTSIRQHLKKQGRIASESYQFNTLSPSGISMKDSIYANTYHTNQMVVLFDDIKQLKQGAYKIIDVDNNKNTLTILDENGEEKTVNAKQYGKHFSTYTMNNKEFSKGDKIVFLKNDAKLGVSNGSLGVIHSIDQEGNASVILNNEKSVEFNMKDINANSSYNYIDYAYAVTVHKSQGATTDHTLYFHDSKNAKPSANSLYVAFTRSRNNTMIFTQSTKLLKKHSEKWIKKSSTLDDYQLDHTSKDLKESPDNNEKKELSQYMGINFRGLFEKASLKTNEDGKQKSVQKETETKKLPQNEMEI